MKEEPTIRNAFFETFEERLTAIEESFAEAKKLLFKGIQHHSEHDMDVDLLEAALDELNQIGIYANRVRSIIDKTKGGDYDPPFGVQCSIKQNRP